MNFKDWLLLERDEVYVWGDKWNPQAKQFHRWWKYGSRMEVGYEGADPIIQAYIANGTHKRISVEYAGPRHPMMKRALRQLLKMLPQLADYPVEFDGYIPGTLMDYVRSSEFHGENKLPKYLYHGTSLYRWERIRDEGLRPQKETGSEAGYGAVYNVKNDPTCVYLAGSYGAIVRFAAIHASQMDADSDSINVILKISSAGLDRRKLRPDHDSKQTNWLDSLYKMDSIGYEGTIAPKWIEVFKVWDKTDKKFVDPRPELLEPQDWLAQHMLHRQGYTDIPGVGSYRWVNLRQT